MTASLSRSRRRPPTPDRATAGAAFQDPARRPHGWTDARTATLERMWADGTPASAIADALGVTRCAVIGKARRLDLDARAPRGNRRLDWCRLNVKVRALWDDGTPTVRIAKTLGIAECTAHRALRAMGLPSRGKLNSHGLGSSPLSVTEAPGPVARVEAPATYSHGRAFTPPARTHRSAGAGGLCEAPAYEPGKAPPDLAPVASAAGAPFGDCIGERGGVESRHAARRGRRPGTYVTPASLGWRGGATLNPSRSSARPALSHAVTIDALTAFTCRWPLGGHGEPATHFCGAPCPSSTPYCAHHTAVATNKHHIPRRMTAAPRASLQMSLDGYGHADRFLGGDL